MAARRWRLGLGLDWALELVALPSRREKSSSHDAMDGRYGVRGVSEEGGVDDVSLGKTDRLQHR